MNHKVISNLLLPFSFPSNAISHRNSLPQFLLFIVFFFICIEKNTAQDSLSTVIDTTSTLLKIESPKEKNKKKKAAKEEYPSPKRAIKLAIIPGMGQIYNKKYWKLPLVYGALGGVIYSINYNTKNYKLTLQSLQSKTEVATGIEPTVIDPFPNASVNAVTAQRNIFDKNRQLSWIGVFGFYLISAGDAFVDAHLKDFSVDDNISFKPVLDTDFYNQPIIGIGLTINLSK